MKRIGCGLKTYYTHDNGGRPFKVQIDSKRVSIYKKSSYDQEYSILVKTFRAIKKIFIGKSPENSRTKFSGGHGKQFDGNTILLYLGTKHDRYRYVYVGEKIFSFTTDLRIKKYISPVGNNDVPYPYAIDKNDTHYLITEGVFLAFGKMKDSRGNMYDDPYSYFYDVKRITPEIGSTIQSTLQLQPVYPNFEGINEFYIDNEPYTLTYHSDPEEHYEFMKAELGKRMYVIKTNGKKVELDKKKYVDLMKRFGEMTQINQIQNKKIIHERC